MEKANDLTLSSLKLYQIVAPIDPESNWKRKQQQQQWMSTLHTRRWKSFNAFMTNWIVTSYKLWLLCIWKPCAKTLLPSFMAKGKIYTIVRIIVIVLAGCCTFVGVAPVRKTVTTKDNSMVLLLILWSRTKLSTDRVSGADDGIGSLRENIK